MAKRTGKLHYPDPHPDRKGDALCGAKNAVFPKARAVRMKNGDSVTTIVLEDVDCKNCRRLGVEFAIRPR